MRQTGRTRTTPGTGEPRRETDRRDVGEAQFLNIDLDVRSRRSLAPLATAWPWSYQPLIAEGRSNPRWLILTPRRVVASAEAAAKDLLDCIGRLRGNARRCWTQAHQRTFDIGIRAGTGRSGRAFDGVRLSMTTLARIAASGARIQVTVYPPEPV